MKRLVFWLIALIIIAMLAAMSLPASGPRPSKIGQCRVDLVFFHVEIENYKSEFGSYPTGNYDQVSKKIFENNPKDFESHRVDPWRTPFAINFLSTNGFVISSAGPNRKFGDADDIIFNSLSNDFVKP
jgi:type II secretory pathway pseudopilin PulG